jgi:hypothetical protein
MNFLARTTTLTAGTLIALAPLAALAQTTVTGAVNSNGDFFLGVCIGHCSYGAGTLFGIFSIIFGIINNILIPLLFAVAFLVFIWGVFKYFILSGGDEDGQKAGRQLILWGLIGFFVMFSVWGLVNILINTFGLSSNIRPPFPML